MRVAFVANIIPHYRKSFYEKLCREFRSDWMICHGGAERNDGRPEYKGQIDIPGSAVQNKEMRVGPYILRWQKGAFRGVRKHDPDAIILSGIVGTATNWLIMGWGKIRKKRLLVWACGWESQKKGSVSLKVKQMVLRHYYRMADFVLVYSTKGKSYLVSMGVNPGKIAVCYNGIETDGYKDTENDIMERARRLRESEGVGDHTVFLYVGGMLREKKVDLLLAAFGMLHGRYPKTTLWLVGDGPDLEYFRTIAETGKSIETRKAIRFWGRIVDGVDVFFAATDFFVLPGLGGLAINQAMYWRKPCIVSEADGTEDDLVIDGESGKRFRNDDASSLFSAMDACRSMDFTARNRMAESCREIISTRSNVNAMVAKFSDVLACFRQGKIPEENPKSQHVPRGWKHRQ